MFTWVGSKARQVEDIKRIMPKRFDAYYEPMIGSGKVYDNLISHMDVAVHLSDYNPDVANVWRMVKGDYRSLVEGTQSLLASHSKEQYYEIREWTPEDLMERAVRFMYLNHTCFNSLWRVNKKGKFNVPMADKPKRLKVGSIRRMHESLRRQDARITCSNVFWTKPKPGSFVYLDPPYMGTFSAYSKEAFTDEDHGKLAKLTADWVDMGVYVVVSNSPLSASLYSHMNVASSMRPGTMNSDGSKRQAVKDSIFYGGYNENTES